MIQTALLLTALLAAEPAPRAGIDLPAPQKTGGMPLMEALAKRVTSRAFDTRALSPTQMSNLLWTAFGVTRPDGKRTAPSSMNRQEIDIYVLLEKGVYLYDPAKHRLEQVLAEDLRAASGKQDFVKDAPLTLVFVANLSKMQDAPLPEKHETAAIDTGFISQNVYLYCASEGLATGVRGWVDRETLAKRMGLRADQHITVAQSVGHPKP